MPTSTTSTAPAVLPAPAGSSPTHPDWCALPFCTATARDVRHSSVPVLLRPSLDDVEVTVSRQRDDHHEPGVGWVLGPDGVLLGLRNTMSATRHGDPVACDVLLAAGEEDELASSLVALGRTRAVA